MLFILVLENLEWTTLCSNLLVHFVVKYAVSISVKVNVLWFCFFLGSVGGIFNHGAHTL